MTNKKDNAKYSDRASKNREMRRDNLRQELKSKEYIKQVHTILKIDNWEDRTQEYNGKLNGYFKLLNKTLPDVKAIELEVSDNSDFTTEYLKRLQDAVTTQTDE